MLGLSGYALAQTTCSVVCQTAVCTGSSGAVSIQQQLNPNTGILIGPDGSVNPYTILTPNAPQLPSMQLPQATIISPNAVPVIIMPTPSVTGY